MSIRLGRVAQDKDEAIAYTIDWSADLNSSTVASTAWTVPSGLTNESTTATTTTSSIRLSGGTPGVVYKIEALATLDSGEKLQGHFLVTAQN